jgi:hypothetical protein
MVGVSPINVVACIDFQVGFTSQNGYLGYYSDGVSHTAVKEQNPY